MSRVEPVDGEPLRFRVPSESKPGSVHMVDLSLYEGQGFCDCEAHIYICEPNRRKGKARYSRGLPKVKKGKVTYPDATICPHVLAAYEYLLPKMLKRLAANATGRGSLEELSASHQTPARSSSVRPLQITPGTQVPF